jgi:hypothetical protein
MKQKRYTPLEMYLFIHFAHSGIFCPNRDVFSRGVMLSPFCMYNLNFFKEFVVTAQKLLY